MNCRLSVINIMNDNFPSHKFSLFHTSNYLSLFLNRERPAAFSLGCFTNAYQNHSRVLVCSCTQRGFLILQGFGFFFSSHVSSSKNYYAGVQTQLRIFCSYSNANAVRNKSHSIASLMKGNCSLCCVILLPEFSLHLQQSFNFAFFVTQFCCWVLVPCVQQKF